MFLIDEFDVETENIEYYCYWVYAIIIVFDVEDRDGISITHSEMQQLFLPYRSICARKGVT